MRKYFCVISTLIFFLTADFNFSQDFRLPRPSPDATVSQYIGITNVAIDYSSPGVKGRKIWGELVPYGQVWRMGANEVTSITFSDAVKVNGSELQAGTYGLHTIPGETEWEMIFSKDTKVDDGAAYDSSKAAARFKVKPETSSFTERMIFVFTDMTDNSAKVNLLWENLKVPFTIEANTQELTLQKARENIDWGSLMAAANYCLQNNINLDEGYRWIEASSLINENYWNTRVQAQYLAKMNKKEDAIKIMGKAIDYGLKMEQAPFDYDRMKELLVEWKGK
jgi:hypothetical protein